MVKPFLTYFFDCGLIPCLISLYLSLYTYIKDDAAADESSLHHSGASVKLMHLQARPELNGQVGILLSFNADAGRWLVRLADGTGKQVLNDIV